jgi:hypothetical protein
VSGLIGFTRVRPTLNSEAKGGREAILFRNWAKRNKETVGLLLRSHDRHAGKEGICRELLARAARCSVSFDSSSGRPARRWLGGRGPSRALAACIVRARARSPFFIFKSFPWKQDVPAAVTKPGDGIA